jgi:RimJ/RimL family protein N-acetyltransferase
MAILETPRLILHPFDEKDVDKMSELMANPDFMRFSLGPKTYEQTAAFLETVIGWHRAGLPSPFAVVSDLTTCLSAIADFCIRKLTTRKKSKLDIGFIPITGTGASPPRRRQKCVITPLAIWNCRA